MGAFNPRGTKLSRHDGNLQNAAGSIIDVNRSSLQGGLGVGAVGAGTTTVPGVVAQFHASDAIFQPRIHEHSASARSHAVDAALNDALLDGALAYLELLRAEQLRAVVDETLANAIQLAKLTATFADAGQGPQADADRAKTEAAIRTNELSRAEEAVEVANAHLVEVLSADPSIRVVPTEPVVVPLHLIDADQGPGELLAIGLSNRPELSEARHLVCEAVSRYERERYAPLLPSVLLGMSDSSFGGGLGGNIGNSGNRIDFDAIAYWELRNLGLGERAARDERWSVYEQRQLEEVRLMDRVAREINVAHAQVRSRKGQIAIAESAVAAATESYERNTTRIKEGIGLPIETLQAIQALDQARASTFGQSWITTRLSSACIEPSAGRFSKANSRGPTLVRPIVAVVTVVRRSVRRNRHGTINLNASLPIIDPTEVNSPLPTSASMAIFDTALKWARARLKPSTPRI